MLRNLSTGVLGKRFYEKVSLKKFENGFGLYLDGKQYKTPLGTPIVIHSKSLALAVASEWVSQKEFMNSHSMPIVYFI